MAHVAGRERRLGEVAEGIIARRSDRYDSGKPARHLIDRYSVNVRVEPEGAGGMVGRNVDPIIDVVLDDRSVLMRRLRHRRAVRRIVDFDENVIAECRILERRCARRDDHAVGVEIRQVERQIGAARLGRAVDLDRIERRQPVHQANLEAVALLQGKADAAIGSHRGRARRALIAWKARRSRADRIDPADRIERLTVVGRRVDDARHGLGLRDHQKIEHAVGAREHRRLDEISGKRRRCAQCRGRGGRDAKPSTIPDSADVGSVRRVGQRHRDRSAI